MSDPGGDEKAAEREPGAVIQASLSTVLRWSTRADNKRTLHDSAGAALTSTDAWLLEQIATSGPIRMSALAEWLAVDRSTISTEVRRLEEAALVERAADPSDRRAVLVSATEEGVEALRLHLEAARDVYTTLVGKWSEHDRTELARLLERFVHEFSWVTDAVGRHNAGR
jgi:DNA-binding MarR family transcriptional regulator